MAISNPINSCQFCRYWVAIADLRAGLCRRFPRTELKAEVDWCGEFSVPPPECGRFAEAIAKNLLESDAMIAEASEQYKNAFGPAIKLPE